MEGREEYREATLENIDVKGTQLHYLERGENNNQTGVFTHDAISDYRSWQFQIEPFSQKYRIVSYSRRILIQTR